MEQNEGSGRVALITGAGRGIGRGIALTLAAHGWHIVINYRANQAAAAETLIQVQQAGGQGILCPADITQPEDRARLAAAAAKQYGRLDLLVNNAGMAPRQRIDMLQTSEASYDEVMNANLKGPFFLTQEIARTMIELKQAGIVGHPQIINISSISAYTSSVERAEYCLSKAAMSMMTKLFAHRLAEYGIGLYEIRPGIIATDMTQGVKEKYDRLFAQGIAPIPRWGQPDDVARAVLAIAQGQLPYSTGEIINVDGGFHLHRL